MITAESIEALARQARREGQDDLGSVLLGVAGAMHNGSLDRLCREVRAFAQEQVREITEETRRRASGN